MHNELGRADSLSSLPSSGTGNPRLHLTQCWRREDALSPKSCPEAECSFPLELWRKGALVFLFITSSCPLEGRAVHPSPLYCFAPLKSFAE